MIKVFVIVIATATLGFGQHGVSVPALKLSRGHYKDLEVYSAKPLSSNEEADRQRFPVDGNAAEKRMSLKPYFLKTSTLDDFDIPEPPANSSERTRAEINYLLRLQQQRTELDVESSLYMAGVFYSLRVQPSDSLYTYYRWKLFHIGRSIGTWFNPHDLPLTAELMAHVWQDASYFIWGFKYKYLRVRPYVLEPAIKNLEDANWAAYPSGHAVNSYVNAFIYQVLAPEFSDIFLKDAYDMAHSREIIGVHYPSDSEAARILAHQLVKKLFQNEKFLTDFEQVKKEWEEKGRENFTRPTAVDKNIEMKPSCCAKKPSSCARTCQ